MLKFILQIPTLLFMALAFPTVVVLWYVVFLVLYIIFAAQEGDVRLQPLEPAI